jgi:hypothetical protein
MPLNKMPPQTAIDRQSPFPIKGSPRAKFAEVGLGECFETRLKPPAAVVGSDESQTATIESDAVADLRRCPENNTGLRTESSGAPFRANLHNSCQTFHQTSKHGRPSITLRRELAQV